MDELELRRRLYADPNTSDKDVLDALESDPDAHAFSNELKTLDNDIEQALNIPVPENLAERLVLNKSLHAFQTQRKKSEIPPFLFLSHGGLGLFDQEGVWLWKTYEVFPSSLNLNEPDYIALMAQNSVLRSV